MTEKIIDFEVKENFYNIKKRSKEEIKAINKIYKALRILKDYCTNCNDCKNCIMRDMCDSIPINWKV